jgi:DNA primase
MRNIDQLNGIKSQLRQHLGAYLQAHGKHDVSPGGRFRCINKGHTDNHPSCGIIKGAPELFHCFGCGASGDIFTAASLLEEKPLRGREFITDNLIPLADMFGIVVPESMTKMSDAELHEMNVFHAYRAAAQVISEMARPPLVDETINAKYSWEEDTPRICGVGWVSSYDEYVRQMVSQHKVDKAFMAQVDLDNQAIFNPNSLIFTIKDEHGNPVGFAARDLKYEEKKEVYNEQYEKMVKEEGEDSPKLAALFCPRKFINSAAQIQTNEGTLVEKNDIYQKRKRLYGFDVARRWAPPLWIFEGYADRVTAYDRGMKNAVAVGSISFTPEHLQLLLETGQNFVIFVLDADEAGAAGTDRFVKLLSQHFGGHPGLRAEILVMPKGTDDPDAYIREHGLDAFKVLERTDVFTWQVAQCIARGDDPYKVCEDSIDLIVNEINNITRLRMARNLAKRTGISEDAVWREVTCKIDADRAKLEEARVALANGVAKRLIQNPSAAVAIVNEAQMKLEKLDAGALGYKPDGLVDHLEELFTRFTENVHEKELITGWPTFDERLGGLPFGDCLITLPGKQNQGKTSFIACLAHQLIDNNANAVVMSHSLDDSLDWFVPRILGSKYNLPSKWFRKAGYYLSTEDSFRPYWESGTKWLREVVKDERLILADAVSLPGTVPAFEGWVRSIRSRYPSKYLVACGDNFHLFDLPGMEEGERKVRIKSQLLKNIANRYHATIVMTVELPKDALRPGHRPRAADIKGSSGPAFDANICIGIYNDLKDFPNDPKLFWVDDAAPEDSHANLDGTVIMGKRKPIIELVFDKVKVDSGFAGSLYYELNPETARYKECTNDEMAKYWATSTSEDVRIKQSY